MKKPPKRLKVHRWNDGCCTVRHDGEWVYVRVDPKPKKKGKKK